MAIEPQKFFIGVIDLFSILLPGALFTYEVKDTVGPYWLGARYAAFGGTEGWIVFLFASYLLGHFVFLIGSWLLDDRLYDPIRTATYSQQVWRLAKGGKLSSPLWRWLARRLIKGGADAALRQAIEVKEHYLGPSNASSSINAFQWCKASLVFEHENAVTRIERFEADSKFFRSLVIVLLFLIPWSYGKDRRLVLPGILFLLVLAFWRYMDQRVKSTSLAYWYMISLEYQKPEESRRELPAPGPSHAGGVVTRQSGGKIEYLVVQAKKAPQEWVLPKGHIEAGEMMAETAVREVQEETGVWASVTQKLDRVSFVVNGETVDTQFYLMEAVGWMKPNEKRELLWLTADAAKEKLTHAESKKTLQAAANMRVGTQAAGAA